MQVASRRWSKAGADNSRRFGHNGDRLWHVYKHAVQHRIRCIALHFKAPAPFCLKRSHMPRHSLLSLFEPRSLLVVSDYPLPISQHTPAYLENRITMVDVTDGQPIVIPDAIAGLEPGARVDQVVVCVSPSRLFEVLSALHSCRPRTLLLLAGSSTAPEPLEELAYSRAWGTMNDCMVLGPRSFGLQRPHLQLNLTLSNATAAVGRVALVAQSRTITAAILEIGRAACRERG